MPSLFACVAVACIGLGAQTPKLPRFNGVTRLVMEAVSVTDPSGAIIPGLTAKDFALTEDGKTQLLSICEYRETGSLSYYLLGYYTTNQDAERAYRQIQVSLPEHPNATLGFRAGYWAGGDSAALTPPSSPDANSDGIRPPEVMHKFEAAYSAEARAAKYQGAAVVQATVSATGQVMKVRVMRSLGLGLDEQAIDALKQWRFKPASQDGRPVPMDVEVIFNFRLM